LVATGFEFPEIVNLVFYKSVKSKTTLKQMIEAVSKLVFKNSSEIEYV